MQRNRVVKEPFDNEPYGSQTKFFFSRVPLIVRTAE